MKMFLKVIILMLLVNRASYSYGMSGDEANFIETGIGLSGPRISVPRLGTQPEEQQAEQEHLVFP